MGNGNALGNTSDLDDDQDEEQVPIPSECIIYHLILEGVDVSYRIDFNGNVIVEKAIISSEFSSNNRNRCNYLMWREQLN